MKIALCIFGQPRFLDNQFIKKFLDEHLYSQGDVDVFTHFWFDKNSSNFKSSDWNHINYLQKDDTIKCIYETYSPKKILYEPPKNFKNYLDENHFNILKKLNYYTENNTYNLLSHLYSFEKSTELVEGEYDFIVITRYDNLILKFPKLNGLKNGFYVTNQYNGNFSDVIFLSTPNFLEGMKVFSNFKDVVSNLTTMTAECVKKEVFLKFFSNTEINYIDLLAGIARSNDDKHGII